MAYLFLLLVILFGTAALIGIRRHLVIALCYGVNAMFREWKALIDTTFFTVASIVFAIGVYAAW